MKSSFNDPDLASLGSAHCPGTPLGPRRLLFQSACHLQVLRFFFPRRGYPLRAEAYWIFLCRLMKPIGDVEASAPGWSVVTAMHRWTDIFKQPPLTRGKQNHFFGFLWIIGLLNAFLGQNLSVCVSPDGWTSIHSRVLKRENSKRGSAFPPIGAFRGSFSI